MNSELEKTRSNGMLAKVILQTGLIAGVLDALGAIVTFMLRGGKNPLVIFNFIASGVFGNAAFSGGYVMTFMGLVFHLCIATIWATLFFIASKRIEFLTTSWITSGIGYGVFVWLCMNLVVVPLSSTPPIRRTPDTIIIGILVLIVCIGLPIAYKAKRFNDSNRT